MVKWILRGVNTYLDNRNERKAQRRREAIESRSMTIHSNLYSFIVPIRLFLILALIVGLPFLIFNFSASYDGYKNVFFIFIASEAIYRICRYDDFN